MFMKKCSKCGKVSYSASKHRTWLCPYCDTDLTKVKVMDVNDHNSAQIRDHSSLDFVVFCSFWDYLRYLKRKCRKDDEYCIC